MSDEYEETREQVNIARDEANVADGIVVPIVSTSVFVGDTVFD